MQPQFSGLELPNFSCYMSHSLSSLKGVIWATTVGLIKGDTRNSDYSSYRV